MPTPEEETLLREAEARLAAKAKRLRGEQLALEEPAATPLKAALSPFNRQDRQAVARVAALASTHEPEITPAMARRFVDERPPECDKCDDRGWIIIPDGGAGTSRRCDCQVIATREQRLAQCDLPQRYAAATFDDFRVTHGPADVRGALMGCKAKAQGYLDRFLELREKGTPFRDTGLLLMGPPGAGKTLLACALLRSLILRYTARGLFLDFTHFLYDVKATFDQGSQVSSSALIHRAARCEVLVIDELGAQKPTPWVLEVLYLLINGRHNNRLPTIYTTNYTMAADGQFNPQSLYSRLSGPIVSRLHSTAHVVTFPDFDYRSEVEKHSTAP